MTIVTGQRLAELLDCHPETIYRYCRTPESARVERRDLRIPTVDEVEHVAGAIDPRCWALVIVCGYCALRQGEALGLHPSDVDWLGRRIHVHRSVEKTTGRRVAETKGGRGRWVTLPTRVGDALSAHVAEYPHGEYVFNRQGGPMPASWLTHAWQDARHAAGVDDVRFHDLRHGAISNWIRAGWSIKRVQTEAGHADPAFTIRVYGWMFPDEIEHGRQQLDALIAGSRDAGRTTSGLRAVKEEGGSAWTSQSPASGRRDLNSGPHRPERCALPGCATPR
jgi:integrase